MSFTMCSPVSYDYRAFAEPKTPTIPYTFNLNLDDIEPEYECYKVIVSKPLTPLPKIIWYPNDSDKEELRKDFYGNKISRKSKTHKVTFRDEEPNKTIADIKLVESYKKYNLDEPVKVEKGKGSCSCCIF